MKKLNLIDSKKLIFIVGCPRSGTTYLQSLISKHKNIVSFPETHFFSCFKNSKKNNYINLDERRKLKEILTTKLEGVINEKNIHSILKETISESFSNLIYFLIKYFKIKIKNSDTFFLEKTPLHFLKIDLIKRIFPKCKIIFIYRNPHKVIVSRKVKIPHTKNATTEYLATNWKLMIKIMEKSMIRYINDVYSIRYETLKKNEISELKNLFSFFSSDLLSFNFYDQYSKNDQIILPFENWKSYDKNDNYSGYSKTFELQKIDYTIISLILSKEMSKYNYPNIMSGTSKFNQLFIYCNFRFKNLLKKFF